MPFPVLGSNSAVAGYEIDNSLRFNDDDSAYLNKTPSSASNRRTWTWSGWFKRSKLGAFQDIFISGSNASGQLSSQFSWNSSDGITLYGAVSGASADYYLVTNALFRDPSAWYHLVLAVDTTQGTNSNRIKLYVNGEQVTSFSSETYPSQNYDTAVNNNVLHTIGRFSVVSANPLDAYLSEVHFIDGSQLTPSSFGETNDNGVWIPKEYEGTYGTNGFKLQFQDSGNLGDDTSGNGNDFTANNLTATDQTTDTPTNNFATMNPVHVSSHGSSTLPTFSEGNLKIAMSDGSSTSSSIAPSSGKWYVEYKQSENTADNQGYPIVGICATLGGTAGDVIGFRTPSGTNYRGQLGTSSIDNAFLSARQANDIFGFYIDLDNSTLIIHKNGSTYMNTGYTGGLDWSGGLTTTNSQTGFFHFYVQSNTGNAFTDEVNFGNPSFSISSGNADANGFGNFEYSPTLSGTNYYALCTKNLAEYG